MDATGSTALYRLTRFRQKEEYLQEIGQVSALTKRAENPEAQRQYREYRLELEKEYFFFTAQRHI